MAKKHLKHKAIYVALALAGVAGLIWVLASIKAYLYKPEVSHWRMVNQVIHQVHEGRDGIAFHPPWLAGYATDHGRFNYASIYGLEQIFKRELDRPDRLWVLRTITYPRLRSKLGSIGYAYKTYKKIGKIQCDLYESAREEVAFDFIDHFAEAEVTIETYDGRSEKALLVGGKFIFKENPVDWNQVGVENVLHSFGWRMSNVIWFHPVQNGVKRIEFRDVPLGSELGLFLGLADSGRRYDKRVPVYFGVGVNGQLLRRLRVDEGNPEQYWKFQVDSFGERGDVFFYVKGGPDVNGRHIFFRAVTRKTRERQGTS